VTSKLYNGGISTKSLSGEGILRIGGDGGGGGGGGGSEDESELVSLILVLGHGRKRFTSDRVGRSRLIVYLTL
jgi:hypothetical protein